MVYLIVLGTVFAVLFLATRLNPVGMTAAGLWLERRISGLATRSIRVDGFDMPYLEGGTGEVLLLIHGFGGDKDNFTRIARFLTPHYRVIIPDLPGFGDATRTRRPATPWPTRWRGFTASSRSSASNACTWAAIRWAASFRRSSSCRMGTWCKVCGCSIRAAPPLPTIRPRCATTRKPAIARCWSSAWKTLTRPSAPPRTRRRSCRALRGSCWVGSGVADFELHTRIMRQLQDSPLLEQTYQPMPTPALVVWGTEDEILSPMRGLVQAAVPERAGDHDGSHRALADGGSAQAQRAIIWPSAPGCHERQPQASRIGPHRAGAAAPCSPASCSDC
ncbi:alpha/beta fold hydrolase [Massilia sp. B-10]|nr:alpha/beta fold hydrolase [Massilia sp. B-10]